MVHYRRNRLPGGTYFFTVTLRDRGADTLTRHIDTLRTVMRETRARRPFRTEAIVVLPDHLHAIWTLPDGDADYPGRWRSIKAAFAMRLGKAGMALQKNAKGEVDLWQRRYWEHTISNDADYASHVDYLHFNPVKHGHVQSVRDWPHSSFHRFVRDGKLKEDWGGAISEAVAESGFGE